MSCRSIFMIVAWQSSSHSSAFPIISVSVMLGWDFPGRWHTEWFWYCPGHVRAWCHETLSTNSIFCVNGTYLMSHCLVTAWLKWKSRFLIQPPSTLCGGKDASSWLSGGGILGSPPILSGHHPGLEEREVPCYLWVGVEIWDPHSSLTWLYH